MIKLEESDKKDLTKLNPKKHLVSKIFRRYDGGEDPLSNPMDEIVNDAEDGGGSEQNKGVINHFIEKSLEEKQPAGESIQQKNNKPKTSKPRKKISLNIDKHLKKTVIPIFVLVLVIVLFLLFIPLSKAPKASFVDSVEGDPISGDIYFNGVLIGETDGNDFKGLPGEYCKEKGTLKLKKGEESFEWKTNPLDCESKKMIFYVDSKKEATQEDIVFKFLDNTNSFYIKGNLYFDDVFMKEISESLTISKEKCMEIKKIKLEYDGKFNEWEINHEFCETQREIKFKVS